MGHQPHRIAIEPVIARLARRQAGAVGHGQLREAGASPKQITSARRRGLLVDRCRGVYLVASVRRTRETLRWAADLATRPDGAVSHDDAAAVWGFRAEPTGAIHITTPRALHLRPGIHFHRSPLYDGDWVLRDGLRLTMPARTLIDLAASFDRRTLQMAIDEAHFLGLVTSDTLAEALERNRGRPGMRTMRALLRTHELGTTRTTTDLEEHVFTLLTRAGLTGFVTQHEIGPYTADFLYPAERLVIEADGANAHGRASRRATDALRDIDLRDRGYETVRIREDEAYDDPDRAVQRVRAALSRSSR